MPARRHENRAGQSHVKLTVVPTALLPLREMALPFQHLLNSQKDQAFRGPSFRRKPESIYFKTFWTSAVAGVTA
jgi:hypothetical protein